MQVVIYQYYTWNETEFTEIDSLIPGHFIFSIHIDDLFTERI